MTLSAFARKGNCKRFYGDLKDMVDRLIAKADALEKELKFLNEIAR